MHRFKNPVNNKDIFILGDYISVTTNYDDTIIAHISELDQIAKDCQLDPNTQNLILSYHKRNKTIQDEDIYFDFSEWRISPKLVAFVTRNEKMIDTLLNYHATQAGEILASRGELASNHYVMLKCLRHSDESVLIGLAKNPNLSLRFVMHLANSEYQRVRANIANREEVPSKIIKMLSQDEDSYYVRQTIASRPSLPLDIIKTLAKDRHMLVRIEIAKRQDLPVELAEDMLMNDDIEVRRHLLHFGHLTPKLIKKAFESSPSDHENFINLLIRRGDIPQDWLPATSFNSILQLHKIGKEELSEETMVKLAESGTFEERIALASREGKLPNSVISLLSHDESPAVRERLAEYAEYLPDEVILLLAQDSFDGTRIEIASRDILPADVIEILVNDENEIVREHIACRLDLTSDQIVKLSQDTEVFVVANLATYRQLPDDIMERLAQHPSNIVKERLIDHQTLNEKAIQILVNDKSAYIRQALAKYQGELPPACLSQLSEDTEPSVRLSVTKRCSLPDDILLKLLNDPERVVRKSICDQFCLNDDLVQLFFTI